MIHPPKTRSGRRLTIQVLAVVLAVSSHWLGPLSAFSAYSVGPSFSVIGAEHGGGRALGLDLTYIATGRQPWWLSGGARFVEASDAYGVAYGELGLGPVGVGYSNSFGSEDIAKHNLHAYLGVPIMLYGMGSHGKPGFYIEPYYRPMFALGHRQHRDLSVVHEVGILIKFTTVKVWAGPPPRQDTN